MPKFHWNYTYNYWYINFISQKKNFSTNKMFKMCVKEQTTKVVDRWKIDTKQKVEQEYYSNALRERER